MHTFLNSLHLFCPHSRVSDTGSSYTDVYPIAPVTNLDFPVIYSFWAWPRASVLMNKVLAQGPKHEGMLVGDMIVPGTCKNSLVTTHVYFLPRALGKIQPTSLTLLRFPLRHPGFTLPRMELFKFLTYPKAGNIQSSSIQRAVFRSLLGNNIGNRADSRNTTDEIQLWG